MAQELEIRLSRPPASVELFAGPGQAPPAPGQAPIDAAAEAQKEIEAERGRLAAAATALEQAAGQFAELQEQFIRTAEAQVVELALEVARKVLTQEVQAGRYEIDPIVREALSRVGPRVEVVVHLNGVDLERCGLVAQQAETTGPGSIRFLADPKIPPGGCLLQTAQGVVESSIDEHLDRVAEALGGEQ